MGVKGDWKRPTNKNHTPKWMQEQLDCGSLGCKRGNHFYIEWKECKYCGKKFTGPAETDPDSGTSDPKVEKDSGPRSA
jgi:hypothetical protein